MIRGTTQTFKFQIPYDFNQISHLIVAFWQKGYSGPTDERKLPIEKSEIDCRWSAENKEISVTLQPEETARFLDDRKAYAQLSATLESGLRFASRQQEITVYPIYKDYTLGDVITPSEGNGLIILDGGEI